MLYFLLWLAITILHAVDFIKFKYLIFLTHWGFIAWNSYLILSTITATSTFYQDKWVSSAKSSEKSDSNGGHADRPTHSCCREKLGLPLSPLTLAYKVQWVLFLIGGELAVVITILYWVFYSDSDPEQNLYSLDSLNLHMINGIFAVVDLWLSGVPVRVYHVVYSIGFGWAYVVFTALYYAAGGRDPEGNRFIYPFLDYGSNPRAAVVLAISCAVLFVGSIHFIFFLNYVVRQYITTKLHQSQCMHDGGCKSPKMDLKLLI